MMKSSLNIVDRSDQLLFLFLFFLPLFRQISNFSQIVLSLYQGCARSMVTPINFDFCGEIQEIQKNKQEVISKQKPEGLVKISLTISNNLVGLMAMCLS